MTGPVVVNDEDCGVFGRLTAGIDPQAVNRFVVGEDAGPRPMSAEEAKDELGDPFATLVLLQGKFPATADAALQELDAALPDGDPLRDQLSFVLGEGSQLPKDSPAERSLRFLVSRGSTGESPEILISTFDPIEGDVELMAWDRTHDGFNYYRTVGPDSAWVWAGNSRHAIAAKTEGKGPFESHTSGSFLMKELKLPWVNWHSQSERIPDDVFPAGHPLREHPFFAKREGAEICEIQVAIPSINRWTRARFAKLTGPDGKVERPARVMEQILATPTVNLASSAARSSTATGEVDLPPTFFVDSDSLSGKLGLPGPPRLAVAADLYQASLTRFDFSLSQGGQVVERGDTHFAFAVPERAFEDVATLEAAIGLGLVSPRLAACLLMVDFPNPVFSRPRRQLLDRAPLDPVVPAEYSELFATAILDAVDDTPESSPERDFAARWGLGDDEPTWRAAFGAELESYYGAIAGRLQTQEGFDDYVKLAESRRKLPDGRKKLPIFESDLLFATTNIEPIARAMRPDGTVTELAGVTP